MANTSKLTTEERKKAKRTARKKRKAEKPLKPRDYPRGSKKPKVKKLARGQAFGTQHLAQNVSSERGLNAGC